MNKLVCHVVAGYPDTEACLELMKGMDKAGVKAIEVQVPFSDPIADGETIMRANDVALEQGMTTKGSFALIHEARRQGVTCDIYVMSYMQKVQHAGLEAFCDEVQACGAKGLILPDLPYDSPEYKHLAVAAGNLGRAHVLSRRAEGGAGRFGVVLRAGDRQHRPQYLERSVFHPHPQAR